MDSNTPSPETASTPTSTLYEAISEHRPELKATLTPEAKAAIKQFDQARADLHEAIDNRGKRVKPPEPAFQDPNIRNVRQANRKVSGRRGTPAKGRKSQKSVEALYGDLEKQGLVRIVRKKGKAPVIKFLPQS